jgi:hypothetical protein
MLLATDSNTIYCMQNSPGVKFQQHKMFLFHLFVFASGWICGKTFAAQQGITMQDKIDAMDDLMLEESTFDLAVSPCDVFTGPSNPLLQPGTGEQTSAEWVRMIFHDFVTADVEAGTG